MIVLASLMSLINQVSGTPYIVGGDSPAGTDCSGLVSWVVNAATDRPVYGDRFNTGNEEGALLARGFQYGTAPNALVVGWNGGHTAVTLPDGTPVSSGERGGVHIGGAGATSPDSRTTCSCRCRLTVTALRWGCRACRLRRRTRRPRRTRRTRRPFWLVPSRRICRLRPRRNCRLRPQRNCHLPAIPEFRIDKEADCERVILFRGKNCDTGHTDRITRLASVK